MQTANYIIFCLINKTNSMLKIKILLSSLLIGLAAISCTDDSFEKNSQTENSVKGITNPEIIEFNYKGIKYSSEYYYKGDSIIILDEKTRNIHNTITTSDSSFILIDEDHTTTYYDNEAEYQEFEKNKIQIRSTDLRPYTKVKIELFQHDPTSFLPHSPKLTINLRYFSSSTVDGYEVIVENTSFPDLGKHGLNNNLTFVKIYTYAGNMTYRESYALHTRVTLYDLDNFRLPANPLHGRDFYELTAGVDWRRSGEYIYATGRIPDQKKEYSTYESYNLKKVFNDKTSSLKITSTIKATLKKSNTSSSSDGTSSGRASKNPNSETERGEGGRSSSTSQDSSSSRGEGRRSSRN